MKTYRSVYFLDMTTGNEVDISTAETPLFMAPSTHCVGGEDSVIVVEGSSDEGQHLVSVRVDGSAKKRLCPVRSLSFPSRNTHALIYKPPNCL